MDLSNTHMLDDAVVTTTMDTVINWGREASLWPFVFGTACCAIEFMSTAASRYDIARFGAEVLRFSPRHADLLVVAGTVSYKQAPILKQIYDQMPEPKWVIAVGACASTMTLRNSRWSHRRPAVSAPSCRTAVGRRP